MATTSTTADDYDDEFAAEEDVNCEFTMTTRPEVMGAAMQALVGNALFDFEHVHRFSQLAPGYLVANFINVQDPVATVFDAAHPPPNPYTGNLASAKIALALGYYVCKIVRKHGGVPGAVIGTLSVGNPPCVGTLYVCP
eukprot:TRINITY_DN403_c1_g1_i2.p2 TRINITY_DN403_c1_g1~~TRINITY_DN403_c1_g1_i2.p2  ORF type:complete len:139 (-),score=29.86 TRINITY_DN403_c1_g1_i2:217-633(-)